MPRQPSPKRAARTPAARRPLALLIFITAPVCLSLGIVTLWQHTHDPVPQTYRASSGLVLALLGLIQTRIAVTAWHRPDKLLSLAIHRRRAFWQWLFVGLVASYVVGLMLGPDPSVHHFFRASLAFWYTVALVPLALSPAAAERCTQLVRRRPIRLAASATFAVAMLFVLSEASLRLYGLAAGDGATAGYLAGQLRFEPGTRFQGQLVNAEGYWDSEFQTQGAPGVFRIAAIGDDGVTLAGNRQTNCLTQLERRVPDVEVYNFGLLGAGPHAFAAQLVHDVARFDPDLVLAFVSAGRDVVEQPPSIGLFDWRWLRVCQMGAAPTGHVPALRQPPTQPDADRETYLRQTAEQLTVCRTPIDDRLRRRWDETLDDLQELTEQCRRRHIRLAMVLVPEEFQVDRQLCANLCRRIGCTEREIDLELPQRRLVAFAERVDLPVLDLLPHFRAADGPLYDCNEERLSPAANDVAAGLLSRWLQTEFGLQESTIAQAPVR